MGYDCEGEGWLPFRNIITLITNGGEIFTHYTFPSGSVRILGACSLVGRCCGRFEGDGLDSIHLVSTRLVSSGLDSSRSVSGSASGIACGLD